MHARTHTFFVYIQHASPTHKAYLHMHPNKTGVPTITKSIFITRNILHGTVEDPAGICVKHKVWIRTIRRFCCTNPRSTLSAANPRITFQPALSADCACANLTMKCTRTKCMCGEDKMRTVYSFCCISAHFSVWRVERDNCEPWDTARPSTSSMIRMRANQRQGPVGGVLLVTPQAVAMHVSFLYGYCSVAYRHRRSAQNWITATPKVELRSQVADETRAQSAPPKRYLRCPGGNATSLLYHAFGLHLSFYLATVVLAYRHARSTSEYCLNKGLWWPVSALHTTAESALVQKVSALLRKVSSLLRKVSSCPHYSTC